MAKRKRNFWANVEGNPIALGRVMAEQDSDLNDYYVQPERYLARALNFNDPAIFFIGAKGIGKSAVLQMVRLEKQTEARRVVEIAPDDLAFSALANIQVDTPLLKASDRNQWLFKSLWDFVLCIELLRREEAAANLGDRLKAYLPWGEAREFKRLLTIALTDDGSPKNLTATMLKLIGEVEVALSSETSGKLSLNQDALRADKLPLLSQINQVARKIADNLKRSYYILIDDLDLHWTGSVTQTAFVTALFQSLRLISRPPHVKCVVAMREDIYRVLPMEDKDKTRDSICQVRWDRTSVKEMIDKRIRVRLSVRAEEIWTRLFQTHHFNRMWKHTTGKPRELIRLSSICLQRACDEDHESVLDEDVETGIREFSRERIDDLASELRHQYSGLDSLIYRLTGYPPEFDMDKLGELALQIGCDVEEQNRAGRKYSWAGGFVEKPAQLGRVLLECNILLYKPNRNSAPQAYDPERDFDINEHTWFATQPMYLPALGHPVN